MIYTVFLIPLVIVLIIIAVTGKTVMAVTGTRGGSWKEWGIGIVGVLVGLIFIDDLRLFSAGPLLNSLASGILGGVLAVLTYQNWK